MSESRTYIVLIADERADTNPLLHPWERGDVIQEYTTREEADALKRRLTDVFARYGWDADVRVVEKGE